MIKYKLIYYVDGDNNTGQSLKGIENLSADDEVHVFYGSKTKYYSEERKADLHSKSRCKLTFAQVESRPDAADFAIAVEISARISEDNNNNSLYILISLDQHFDTIAEQLKRVFSSKVNVFRDVSIEAGLAKYFAVKIDSVPSLERYLCIKFGEELGRQVKNNIEDIFFMEHRRKNSGKKVGLKMDKLFKRLLSKERFFDKIEQNY